MNRGHRTASGATGLRHRYTGTLCSLGMAWGLELVAALAAGVVAEVVRRCFLGQNALALLAECTAAFGVVYLAALTRWTPVPLASKATSAGVSSR